VTLELESVTVGYGDSPVLEDVSLTVEPGSVHALLGPNGVGKSTLLQTACGLLDPDAGRVCLDGTDLTDCSRSRRAAAIAFVPQSESPTFSRSVFQAVLLGRSPHTSWRPSQEDRERVGRVLSQLDLADLATRSTEALSEGQRRKVAIARLLVQDPSLMVLDEPTASLDLRHRLEVLGILAETVADRSAAGLLAMHDIELAARFADRITLLAGQRVFDTGPPEAVLTADTIREVYGVEATVDRQDGRLAVRAHEPIATKS
jgi:iron complex transport system ATP-binding protein